MLRIGQVEATATQDGKYTDGSVAGGIAATRLRAAAFNAMQEELAHIVESAGLALDINDMTQVLKAIQKLTLSRANPFADIKSDGAAAISTALTNLGFGEGANWVMLPGGMIIQRVYLGFPIGTNVRHITFPRSFTTTNYSISINWNDIGTVTTETQSPANVAVVHQTKSLTGASIWQAGPGGFNVDIIAVGY